jgi:hypothetical protein
MLHNLALARGCDFAIERTEVGILCVRWPMISEQRLEAAFDLVLEAFNWSNFAADARRGPAVYLFIAPRYLHHPRTFKRYLFFHSVDCHVLLSTDLTCILFSHAKHTIQLSDNFI